MLSGPEKVHFHHVATLFKSILANQQEKDRVSSSLNPSSSPHFLEPQDILFGLQQFFVTLLVQIFLVREEKLRSMKPHLILKENTINTDPRECIFWESLRKQ